MRFRVCFTLAPLVIVGWITWGRAGPLGGKWRPLVEKVWEWYVESWHLQGCSPRLCQLNDQWVHPREQVLSVPIACYWYGPSKPSSLSSTDAWLKRETGYGPVNRSASVLWIVSGAPFLESSGIRPNLSVTRERLLYVDHVRYVWLRSIHRPSMENVWCVGQIFPYMVYIDSNHRDSRIWVTACSLQSSCNKLMK
jgi:hypothetical protein